MWQNQTKASASSAKTVQKGFKTPTVLVILRQPWIDHPETMAAKGYKTPSVPASLRQSWMDHSARTGVGLPPFLARFHL